MSTPNHVHTQPPATELLSTESLQHLISRKKKRGHDSVQQHLHGTFTLGSHSSTPSVTKRTFFALFTIARARLPLTYLDTSGAPNRLFRARLKALEDGGEKHGPDPDPRILIAQEDGHQETALYAVERVREGTYALCRLANWVTVDQVQYLAGIVQPVSVRPLEKLAAHSADSPWWQNSILPTAPSTNTTWPTKAANLSICRPVTDTSQAIEKPQPGRTLAKATEVQTANDLDSDPERLATEADQDVYPTLLAHYLKTLYVLKTPLSYFAKGPMSRARAVSSRATTASGLQPWELASALRSYLISSAASDKKYRDKLPELLKDMPSRADEPGQPAKKKKKRKKKLRMDKYGMLPDEDEYFTQWWQNDDSPSSSTETVEQIFRKRSVQLRTRETFLQIMFVLEAIALEDMQDILEKEGTSAQDDPIQADVEIGPEKMAWKKARKSQDLNLHLELLLDKLCIWNSLDLDLESDKAKAPASTGKDGRNELSEFCVEVVVPFYMARVPQQAAVVNKKLGGPSATTKSKSKPRKPGEPEERLKSEKKARKPLHRVATETINPSAKTIPSLGRSSTDSLVVPGLKREISDVPLEQIPRKGSQPPAPRRNTAFDLMKRRELNVNAITAANEAKMKKKAEVEERLREAITALRKPNRTAAGQELAEVAEQRSLMAQGRARASQSQKARSMQSVQVSATPKADRRTKNMVEATPFYRQQQPISNNIPSSAAMIPSSGTRPLPAPRFPSMDGVPQTGHRRRHAAIQETPSRGSDKFSPLLAPESAIKAPDFSGAKTRAIMQTPSKPTRTVMFDVTPTRHNTETGTVIEATPVKAAHVVIDATPVKARDAHPNAREEMAGVREGSTASNAGKGRASIYDALGWDDDFDDIA